MARFGGVPMLIAVVCASPAMAHGRGDVPVLNDSLRFEVVGRVAVDCSLRQSRNNVTVENAADPLTNVVRAAQVSLPFSVSCNTPVSVSLDSRNGGLRYQGASTSDRAFTQLISYGARVALPGHANVLNCRSGDMAARNTVCRTRVSDSMISGEGSIDVTLEPGGLMLQGTYEDRVTITITPLLGSAV